MNTERKKGHWGPLCLVCKAQGCESCEKETMAYNPSAYDPIDEDQAFELGNVLERKRLLDNMLNGIPTCDLITTLIKREGVDELPRVDLETDYMILYRGNQGVNTHKGEKLFKEIRTGGGPAHILVIID